MIALLALCVVACNAAAVPMGQTGDNTNTNTNSNAQSGTGTRRDWAVCYVNGKELKPGQRGTSGSFVYECQLADNVVRTSIVACLDDGDSAGNNRGEHALNDRWVEGERPFRYVFECAKTGSVTMKRVAQCFYDSTDGSVKLDPGSEQKVGKNVVRCERQGEGGVQYYITYGPTEARSAPISNGNDTVNTVSNANTNVNTINTTTNTNTTSNTNANANSGGNSTNVANDAPKDQVHKCK